MGRARRTSLIEDLLFAVAKLPWWMGVVLAIVSYLTLNPIAERPLAVGGRPSSVALQAVWTGLATAGQYVLPLVFMVAAALSAWQRRQRCKLVADATGNPAIAMLEGLSWTQFEQLVGEGYRLQGYRVAETGGGGPDGGVDLALKRGSELFLVHCKHWRAFKVGVEVVRELYGVMAARGAAGGKVVTSGWLHAGCDRLREGPKHRAGRRSRVASPALACTAGEGGSCT